MDNGTSNGVFDLLVWGGVLISVIGLGGLIWCIVFIAQARREQLPDDEMRARLRKAIPANLGALFLSVLGLMLVVLGIFLR